MVQGMRNTVSCRAQLCITDIPDGRGMALLMAHLRSSTTSRIRAEVSCAVSDTMRWSFSPAAFSEEPFLRLMRRCEPDFTITSCNSQASTAKFQQLLP